MKKNVVIAGGGTGGHVYPGVAVANAVKSIDPDVEIHFVGTARGIETKIVPKEGFSLHTIPVGKLHSSAGLLTRLKTVLILPFSFLRCLLLCMQLRPVAVLGVGGYASGPFVLIASLLGIKTFIWEPNAVPGMANRILSRFVKRAYVVFQSAEAQMQARDVKKSGVPVRFAPVDVEKKEGGDFKILVFGGSQGARAINEAFFDLYRGGFIEGVHIVHQIGKTDFARFQKEYADLPEAVKSKVEMHEFLFDMQNQYANADLVICRGGASTMAELMVCGKAVVIIPLPTAADDHQRKNAEELLKASAGEMILQSDLTVEVLRERILSLKADSSKLKSMSENIRTLYVGNSAEELAKDLLV